MADPHVVSLTYRFVPDPGVDFVNPPAIDWTTADFAMRLEDNVATFKMITHFAERRDAQQVVDASVRAWEVWNGLERGQRHRFEYVSANVVDRLDPRVVYLEGSLDATVSLEGSMNARMLEYPPPPTDFKLTPEVESLWHRYDQWHLGREPVQGMAYFVLSWLEASYGSRAKAAQSLSVSIAVLNKLAQLVSTVGTDRDLRKVSAIADRRALTGPEQSWLDATVRILIRRFGEVAASPHARRQITLDDLPPLDLRAATGG